MPDREKSSEEDDYVDLGFEDYKRAMKIFNDEELPDKDPGELHWREQQILAQREFSAGKTVQAIIILHGLIEIELNRIAVMISVCKSKGNFEKINFEEKNYKKLVEFVEEENALDEDSIRDLKEFNQLRNSISHNLYGAKQKTPHKTELENKFMIGVSLAGSLPVEELKYLQDQGRGDNKFAKKLIKVMDEESEKDLKEKYGDKLL